MRFVSALAGMGTHMAGDHGGPVSNEGCVSMVILVALLLVLIFAGLGFALHVLWIVAAVLLVLWLIGLVIGRGEGAGSRRFYRW